LPFTVIAGPGNGVLEPWSTTSARTDVRHAAVSKAPVNSGRKLRRIFWANIYFLLNRRIRATQKRADVLRDGRIVSALRARSPTACYYLLHVGLSFEMNLNSVPSTTSLPLTKTATGA